MTKGKIIDEGFSVEVNPEQTLKQTLVDYLSKEPNQVIEAAYVYAKNYVMYGIDITKAWKTAAEQTKILREARMDGFYEGYCKGQEFAESNGRGDKHKSEKIMSNQELCEDAISRSAAEYAVRNIIAMYIPILIGRQEAIPLELASAIRKLPSVIPQTQKTGHWIYESDKEHGHCSRCGAKEDLVNGKIYNYCRVCGARMTESEVEDGNVD